MYVSASRTRGGPALALAPPPSSISVARGRRIAVAAAAFGYDTPRSSLQRLLQSGTQHDLIIIVDLVGADLRHRTSTSFFIVVVDAVTSTTCLL